jgi:hypothetical protein
MPQLFSSLSSFYRTIPHIRRWGVYIFLSISIVILCLTSSVHASGTVVLQHQDLKTQIPLTDLKAFAAGQESSPTLQQFWQKTNQNPAQIRQWLTAEIPLPEAASLIAPDFVLLQVNKTLGDPLGRESLKPLRTAFEKSLQSDQSFSILELLQNYPESQVRLETSRLEQGYTDANLLVTRIGPVLKISEALLPELICECNIATGAAATTAELNPSQATTAYQTRDAIKSLLPVQLATADGGSASKQSILQPDNSLVALKPSSSPDLANKSLVFQFGPFGRSISLQNLTRFAETGEISRGWRFFFNVAGVDPENVRTALNQEVSVSLGFLDRTLNNVLGEFLLYQVGQVVHTRSNTANIQALRAASVLAAADDNHLSLLEVLQQYPTPQVYINGLRLARLGQNASRFQARGGVRAAAVSLEDWLVELQASTAANLCTCDKQSEGQDNPTFSVAAPTISAAEIAKYLPPNWQPVAPHREDRGAIKVVWLQGSPYEMGYQHGQYLHNEIASLGSDIIGALRFAGRGLALGRLAARRSYPEIVEECRGLTAATEDIGMTIDACLVLAYGDVFQEIFANTLPDVLFWDGCSQWVATGAATVDGQLYHGSTLDNDQKPIDYIVNNPVVFVRQPNDGLPHVFITYPGVVWPNWGLNIAGITLGLDTAHPGPNELSFLGRSNVQIMGQILKTATSFAEARQIMETQPRVHADLIMITDGKSKQAGVFEFTGKNLGVRELPENGVLYMTNHMASDAMFNRQKMPLSQSSLTRFKRFGQLMEPGDSSFYGKIDPTVMVKIGRNRVNPYTLEASPFDVFDDDASPGGNGSLRQGLYDPDKLLLWVAGGKPPVPQNPFVCFSLGEMLNFPNPIPCASPAL